jgi:hypothetical protein
MKIKQLFESSITGIFYHGTNKKFNEFDVASERVNRGNNVTGIYFTPREEEALEYGSRIIKAHLTVKKPFYHNRKNVFTSKMLEVAKDQLMRFTNYGTKESWVDSVIIPDLQEKGNFMSLNVNGDIKREILLAGGYDSFVDGAHVVILTPTRMNVKVIK